MSDFEAIMSLLDFTLNTKRKRHLVGGVLLSISALFGGLAITIMTLDNTDEKEKKDEQRNNIHGRISYGSVYGDSNNYRKGDPKEDENFI